MHTHFIRTKVKPFLQCCSAGPSMEDLLMRSTAVSQLSGELMAAWCCSASVLPIRVSSSTSSPHQNPSLCAHLDTELSNSDSALPVNGSMLVGGVSQLAQTLWPLSDFCSHSWWNIFTVLTFRGKRQSRIFYLSRLTNIFCSRQAIDLVHHFKIRLSRQSSSLAFVVEPPILLVSVSSSSSSSFIQSWRPHV